MGTRIDVLIGGDRSIMRYVERIEYYEAFDRLDALVVDMSVHRQADSAKILEKVVPGADFAVELIEDDAVKQEGVGDVLEVKHLKRQRGGHELKIVGLDGLHRLRGNQPAQLWETSHKDIVSAIATRHSLKAVADGVSTTAGFTLQSDLGDAIFLRNLARQHNYLVRVLKGKSGMELHFARRATSGADVVCEWGTEILEMSLRASLDGIVTKVTVHGYDPQTDQMVKGEATDTDTAKITSSDTGVALWKKAFGEQTLILNHSGHTAATNAKAHAAAELQQRAERFVSGRVVVPGRPDAVSGRKLTVKNAGWPMTGDFLIRETRHISTALGYRTIIDFISDSLPTA